MPAAAPGPSPSAAELARAAAYALDEYQWFHAHPELANQEHATAGRLAATLEAMGYEVQRGVGGTGLVALLKGQLPGTGGTVLYRADMDGLPVHEQTGLPYQSQTSGIMHACGHDLHMATALGALRVLAESRARWSGNVVFVAQPAEEIGAGARQMLADPKLRQILARTGKPRVALAQHDAADLPAGQVAVSATPRERCIIAVRRWAILVRAPRSGVVFAPTDGRSNTDSTGARPDPGACPPVGEPKTCSDS